MLWGVLTKGWFPGRLPSRWCFVLIWFLKFHFMSSTACLRYLGWLKEFHPTSAYKAARGPSESGEAGSVSMGTVLEGNHPYGRMEPPTLCKAAPEKCFWYRAMWEQLPCMIIVLLDYLSQ